MSPILGRSGDSGAALARRRSALRGDSGGGDGFDAGRIIGGAAQDEGGGDFEEHARDRLLRVFDAAAQGFDSGVGEAFWRHADGGERGIDELGEMDVVKTEDRHRVGDVDAAAREGADGSDGGEVVGADDGGGQRLAREDAFHAAHSALDGMVAFEEPADARRAAGFPERAEERLFAELCGELREGAADEGDFSMSEGGEVLHGFADSALVVDAQGAGMRTGRRVVDVDERNVRQLAGELAAVGFFLSEGQDGGAVDAALAQGVQAAANAIVVVAEGAGDHFVAICGGLIFECLDEFGEEGVGEVGDEQSKPMAVRAREMRGRIGVREEMAAEAERIVFRVRNSRTRSRAVRGIRSVPRIGMPRRNAGCARAAGHYEEPCCALCGCSLRGEKRNFQYLRTSVYRFSRITACLLWCHATQYELRSLD